MKKSILLLLVVGALTLAGCSAGQNGKPDSAKSAIASVLAQRVKLKAEEQQAGLLNNQYLSKLMAIDVQNCPADFRSAWFDYLVERESLHVKAGRVAIIASAEGKPVADVPSLIKFAAQSPALGQYLLGALNETDEAWKKLERAAMNYGVMPETSTHS